MFSLVVSSGSPASPAGEATGLRSALGIGFLEPAGDLAGGRREGLRVLEPPLPGVGVASTLVALAESSTLFFSSVASAFVEIILPSASAAESRGFFRRGLVRRLGFFLLGGV